MEPLVCVRKRERERNSKLDHNAFFHLSQRPKQSLNSKNKL